jgi:hypothetical protein
MPFHVPALYLWFRVKSNIAKKVLPEKNGIAIIDLNLVISEKPVPIKTNLKLPVTAVVIGTAECIYIIF